MKKNYSRREMQGWGSIKQPIIRNTLSITNVAELPEVREKFGSDVESLVLCVMEGLGYRAKVELDGAVPEQSIILDMYDDLEKSGLRFISSLYAESDIKNRV